MAWMDDYEPVEVRLEQFWKENLHGRVWTELKLAGQEPGELVVVWAAIYRDKADLQPWATGIAHQRILGEPPSGRGGRPNESSPEWTSPYEVCETSAIGRALANAGYAAKGKRASREEVEKSTSANELYDVTEWLEQLPAEQRDALRSWWKETEGLQKYTARAIPGTWLAVIRDKIKEVKSGLDGRREGGDMEESPGVQAGVSDEGAVAEADNDDSQVRRDGAGADLGGGADAERLDGVDV